MLVKALTRVRTRGDLQGHPVEHVGSLGASVPKVHILQLNIVPVWKGGDQCFWG